jgi:hypothetical protein
LYYLVLNNYHENYDKGTMLIKSRGTKKLIYTLINIYLKIAHSNNKIFMGSLWEKSYRVSIVLIVI